MKKFKYILFILIIIIFLTLTADGFGDLLICSRSLVSQMKTPHHAQQKFIASLPQDLDRKAYSRYFHDSQTLQVKYTPLVEKQIVQGDYGIYKIDQTGKRIIGTGSSRHADRRLLLLGASQTFGLYNPSEDSLASKLSTLLPNYQIDNYAVPGHTLSRNLANWLRINVVEQQHYDSVVVLNGPFDYISVCSDRDISHNKDQTLPRLLTIWKKITNKFSNSGTREDAQSSFCDDTRYQDMIVKHIIMDFDALKSYGLSQKTTTLLFIPPVPWGNHANVANLLQEEATKNLTMQYGAIAKKLSFYANQSTDIVDLSSIFDNIGNSFFLDLTGHLTPQGNQILAEQIAARIKEAH
ncbi:hypothetical protein ABHF91_00545 [Pseudaeromonas sp. ZJS20]|uniref:hypothetical protein n=1 Tax=Pseudaeromonas aegiceratis TaxID=3153928 RepID=UPI00390CB06D